MFFNYPPINVNLKNQVFLYGFYILTSVNISEKKEKSILCAEKYSPFLHHHLWPFLSLNLSLYLYHNNILIEHVLGFFFKAQPGYHLVTMNAPMPESRYRLQSWWGLLCPVEPAWNNLLIKTDTEHERWEGGSFGKLLIMSDDVKSMRFGSIYPRSNKIKKWLRNGLISGTGQVDICWELSNMYSICWCKGHLVGLQKQEAPLMSGKHSQEGKVRQEERHGKNIKVKEILWSITDWVFNLPLVPRREKVSYIHRNLVVSRLHISFSFTHSEMCAVHSKEF